MSNTPEQDAYLALLRLPHSGPRSTQAVQAAMATLRDHIADVSGKDPELVQGLAEQVTAHSAALSALSARDEGLEALRELSERATKGEWRPGRSDMMSSCGGCDMTFKNIYVDDPRGGVHKPTNSPLGLTVAKAVSELIGAESEIAMPDEEVFSNAALIAAAVNYVRNKLAATERGEAFLQSANALPARDEGLEGLLAKALRRLAFWAQTSGGTAGRDDGLVAAIDVGLAALRQYDTKVELRENRIKDDTP